jgi:hypothetical protein
LPLAGILGAIAAYSVFAVVRSLAEAPPPHGHNKWWVPAMALILVVALAAAIGAVRAWQLWYRREPSA